MVLCIHVSMRWPKNDRDHFWQWAIRGDAMAATQLGWAESSKSAPTCASLVAPGRAWQYFGPPGSGYQRFSDCPHRQHLFAPPALRHRVHHDLRSIALMPLGSERAHLGTDVPHVPNTGEEPLPL